MFNHKDYLQSSSYQLQLVGRKKWHVCPPSEDKNLYNPGMVTLENERIHMSLSVQGMLMSSIRTMSNSLS
jgi:ribosomal protein L16 Arg81 hydroxylase